MNLYDKCPYDWLVHLEDENRLQKSYTSSLYHNKQSPLPDFGLVVEKVFFLKRADPCKVFAVANQAIHKESKVSTKRRSSLNNPGTHCRCYFNLSMLHSENQFPEEIPGNLFCTGTAEFSDFFWSGKRSGKVDAQRKLLPGWK